MDTVAYAYFNDANGVAQNQGITCGTLADVQSWLATNNASNTLQAKLFTFPNGTPDSDVLRSISDMAFLQTFVGIGP